MEQARRKCECGKSVRSCSCLWWLFFTHWSHWIFVGPGQGGNATHGVAAPRAQRRVLTRKCSSLGHSSPPITARPTLTLAATPILTSTSTVRSAVCMALRVVAVHLVECGYSSCDTRCCGADCESLRRPDLRRPRRHFRRLRPPRCLLHRSAACGTVRGVSAAALTPEGKRRSRPLSRRHAPPLLPLHPRRSLRAASPPRPRSLWQCSASWPSPIWRAHPPTRLLPAWVRRCSGFKGLRALWRVWTGGQRGV